MQSELDGLSASSIIDKHSAKLSVINEERPDEDGDSSPRPSQSAFPANSEPSKSENSVIDAPRSPGVTDLDHFLLSQRPYRVAARKSMCSSFDSRAAKTKKVSWSWVSTFSISEISNVPVLELPLSSASLFDSELWTGRPDAVVPVYTILRESDPAISSRPRYYTIPKANRSPLLG